METSGAAPDESLARETEQRLALIASRFPNRFDEAQLGQIRERIKRTIKLGRSLRKATLSNGDGPDLMVTAFPQRAGRE